MIHHMVSFTFKPEVPTADIARTCELFTSMLEIPAVTSVVVGVDSTAPEPNANRGYTAVIAIEDADGYRAYLAHPIHTETLSFGMPLFAATAIRDVCPDRETAAAVHGYLRR
jgi:hypothetical protein